MERLCNNNGVIHVMIAGYIVDERVINEVAQKHPDEVSRRAYAYYRMLYNKDNETSATLI